MHSEPRRSPVAPCPAGLLLAALLLGAPAGAQPIAFADCKDASGQPVATQQRFGLGRVAATERTPAGRPVVVYDPMVLAWLAPVTRLWLHAHECAHLALGHSASGAAPGEHSLHEEQEADCWAARTLVAAGQVRVAALATIQGDLAGLSRADWGALAGPPREVPLQACVEEARGLQRRRAAQTGPGALP
jgi:hypothetical protein